MNIRSILALDAVVVLALLQCGCQGLAGVRYHEGAALDGGGATHMAEVIEGEGFAGGETEMTPAVRPPHSRFHPVPTRPVFAPQPEAEMAMAGAILHRAPEPAAAADDDQADPVPPLPTTASDGEGEPVASSAGVITASHVAPASATQDAARATSRKPTTMKSVVLPAAASEPLPKVGTSPAQPASSQDGIAPAHDDKTRPALGDGWHPRVAE